MANVVARVVTVAAACLLLGGCAIGKTSAGGYVLGIDVPGGTPETAGEGIASVAAALPGIAARAAAGDWIGALAGGAGALTTLAAGVFGVRKASEAAKLKGESDGWDQREKAASVQMPIPTAA